MKMEYKIKNTKKRMRKLITKDNGSRIKYNSGLVREIKDSKPRYDLIYLPLLKEWGNILARGAEKYGDKNYENANSVEELNHFKASLWRHFIQYIEGEEDEAHHAAILFNISAIEYLKNKLKVDINGKKSL